MAGFPQNPDLLSQFRDMQEDVRRLLTRRREDVLDADGYSHAWVIGGEVPAALYIPPWRNLHPDPLGTGDPTITIDDFGVLPNTGAVTSWHYETSMDGTTWGTISAGDGMAYGEYLRPVVVTSTGVDVSFFFHVTVVPPPGTVGSE